ncbi:MAG: Lytic transglycosylase, catalytic [Candidatus Angelobacter sp.]|nr:Lytic transglycosylase, catalytic [Candidatus Angelobacter sp.]
MNTNTVLIFFRRPFFLTAILAVILLIAGCETSNPKPNKVTPPAGALAPSIPRATPKAEVPKVAEEKPIAKSDPVEGMIKQAEQEYQAGQVNYASGHLEAAKANFDRAVNVLIQGPVDVRSDERLQREFDKIVDGIHSLEMVALKEGDGFSEQKAEPAPIDEANDVTFPVDPALKARAEAELRLTRSDLPLVINDYVAGYINFFSTRGRGTFINASHRAGRYQEMIRRTLKEEGVPQDLIYLAQAESGFHPLALSKVGARGMWQFMHYTAPGYGLQRNWWVDDRQDPEKSTRAAAKYLKDLYNQFGDWYLAMAAYNSGAGNVQRAVQRTGYADFWELYRRNVLPLETKNYVPIIVAMTIMAKNPAQYGLTEGETEPAQSIDTVKVDYAVDLRLVAEAVDAPVETLAELNPSLLRMVTPKDAEFELKLPAGTRDKFQTAMAAIPEDKRVLWRYHKVSPGETLGGVAKKYRTTEKAITEVNNLESEELVANSRLVIPVTAGKKPVEGTGSFSKHATHYKVRKGDTVLSVADDFGVPPEKVRKWNHLKGNSLRAGRGLLIYKPVAGGRGEAEVAAKSGGAKKKSGKSSKTLAKASPEGKKTHTVQQGETLTSIANRYNTTVAALHKYNRRASENLHPGDVLVVKE